MLNKDYEMMIQAYKDMDKAFKNYKHKVTPNNKLKRQGLPMRRQKKKQHLRSE